MENCVNGVLFAINKKDMSAEKFLNEICSAERRDTQEVTVALLTRLIQEVSKNTNATQSLFDELEEWHEEYSNNQHY